jgi:RNA polymerase sigma factor (sigma-70 family)
MVDTMGGIVPPCYIGLVWLVSAYDGWRGRKVTVDHHDWLAERFEESRTRLRAVAYRMLGSVSEADDAVQEGWLRVSRSDTSGVENVGGWLTTIVGRVSLDMLRSRKSRREEHLDLQVPEPVVSRGDGVDPEHEAVLADSVGLALLVVLETLAPVERVAFVLHDVFAVPFDEIAPIVGRSPNAAKMLASRARRRVQAGSVPDTNLTRQREVVDAFLAAPAAAISTRFSRCSTQTSWFEPTPLPCPRAHPDKSAVRTPWPSRRSPSRGAPSSHDRRS